MQFGIVLLLLLGISFAEPLDLMPAVPGMAVIVTILLAIAYMAGNVSMNPQLQAWVKSELREFIAAIILIVVIFAAFITLEGGTRALSGDYDYLESSELIIENMLTNETHGYDAAYKSIIIAATKIRMGASYSPWLTVPVWLFSLMYSSSPLSGMSIMLVALSTATQGLANVIFLYEALLLLMRYLHVVVPTILLPLAFMVRLIPFTRRLGNTLIALCLGGLIILPFSVIIVGEVNNIIDYPVVKLTGKQIDKLDANNFAMDFSSAFCGLKPIRFILSLNEYGFAALTCLPLLAWPPAFAACYPIVSEVVYPLLMTALKLVQLGLTIPWLVWAETSVGVTGGFGDAAGANLWPQKVFNTLLPFIENVNNLVLVGYLDMALIAIITISGTRSVSTALGGEWYLAGVERLI